MMASSVVPVEAWDDSFASGRAESDEWGCILAPPRAGRVEVGAERRGRPSTAVVAARGGPPVLAVVVGERQGRGAREVLSRRSGAASRVRASLQVHPLPEDRVLGLVAFAGWRIVDGAASDACAFELMQALADWHCRSAHLVHFAEHRVLSACVFRGEVPPLPLLWKHTDPHEVGRQVFGALTALGAQCQAGGGQQEVSALVAAWAARYGLAAGSPVLWPVWTPLAVGLTSGAWPVDMSAWIHQGEHSVAPSAPSLAARRLQSRMPFCLMPPVDLPGAAPAVWRARKGSVQGYTGAHLVACVRACRQIGRLSKLKEAIDDAYNFLNPSRRRGRVASRMERSSTDVASKDTLARAVVRLDQAAMLWRRKSWRRDGPVFRHIAFDASPQHGQEVFVTVERVTARVALAGCR